MKSDGTKDVLEQYKLERKPLINLLNETLLALQKAGKTENDVMFVAHTYEKNWCFWDEFKNYAQETNYPRCNIPYIDRSLTICGADWLLIRSLTSSGLEGWRYVDLPKLKGRKRKDFFNDWQ